MNGPRIRWVLVTLLLVGATQGAVYAIREKYEPRTIRAPRQPLQALPTVLGKWTSDPEATNDPGMSEQVIVAIGANDAMTRAYTDPDGTTCSVHLATWHASDEWTPHPPELCYKGAGFAIREAKADTLPDQPQAAIRAIEHVSTSTGEAISTLHWYQIGNKSYFNRDGSRSIRKSFWGRSERPPLIKVLMQCNAPESPERDEKLKELAGSIYDFVSQL